MLPTITLPPANLTPGLLAGERYAVCIGAHQRAANDDASRAPDRQVLAAQIHQRLLVYRHISAVAAAVDNDKTAAQKFHPGVKARGKIGVNYHFIRRISANAQHIVTWLQMILLSTQRQREAGERWPVIRLL